MLSHGLSLMTTEIKVTEEYLFPSMVWFADIDGSAALNDALVKHITHIRKELKSTKRSNEMGWHSPTNLHNDEGFAELCACIDGMSGTVAASMNMRNDRRLAIESFWVNINPKFAYNALHDHPQSMLSGVYYVRADDQSGCLRFRDPRAAKRMNPWPVGPDDKTDQRHWDRVNYKPQPGRLIMFPSWLEHDVEPNMSDEDRISISFNLELRRVD